MAIADQIVASQALSKEQLVMLAGTLKHARLGVEHIPESERFETALANGSLGKIGTQMPDLLNDMIAAHERILGHAIKRESSTEERTSARGISRRDFLTQRNSPNATPRNIGG